MSKIKMSFSLILALFLVGILSSTVFAAGVSLKTFQAGKAAAIVLTGGSATTNYNARVTVAGTDIKPDTAFSTDGTGAATVYVPLTEAQLSGQAVTVTIYAADDTTKVTGPSTAFTTSTISTDVINKGPNNYTYTSGLINSNHTGVVDSTGRTNRTNRLTPVKQQMHGFYQNNTNSCASCHQTHTAANGDSLLFKDGTYSTCSACHDGTTGADNNFSPVSSSTVNTIDGTFNVQQVDTNGINHNGSAHQADGSLKVSAAPGGNHTADGSALNTATWGSEFDCASCHSAHGGGSNGENNLNTNPLGWGGVKYVSAANGGSLDQQNGKLFTGRTISTTVPTTFTDTYILVSTTAGAVATPTATKTSTGYLYYRAGLTDPNTPVIQTYRWDGSKYVADYSLWLRTTGYTGAPFQKPNTVLYDTNSTDITANNMTVVWQRGFAFGPGVTSVTKYDLSIGIDVETPVNDPAALYDNTSNNYVVDAGTEMSKYCTACHTDYLSTTRTNNTGLYSLAHRHATAQDRLTCVRCHFAHGSDAQIIKDANDNSYYNLTTGTSPNGQTVNTLTSTAALQYLADPNPSSALKRYTGMSVCYACHGKGEAFLGNPNIGADTTTGQYLFDGDPGIEGSTGVPGATRAPLTTRHNASTVSSSVSN